MFLSTGSASKERVLSFIRQYTFFGDMIRIGSSHTLETKQKIKSKE